jgi:hypothetical protein
VCGKAHCFTAFSKAACSNNRKEMMNAQVISMIKLIPRRPYPRNISRPEIILHIVSGLLTED